MSLCPCVLSQTAQTFATTQRGGGQEFTYNYPTPTGQSQNLQVRLNLDDITRGSLEFQAWDKAAVKTAALNAMQTAVSKLETPDTHILLTPTPTGTSLSVKGTNPQIKSPQFAALLEKTMDLASRQGEAAYARAHYYRIIPKGPNSNAIMPNHPVIALRYTAAMFPVAQALRQQVAGADANPRAFINAALNWLQTIPYDTLDDRTTSNGAGFQTPYGLMLGNRGDCDTKATALAALIHAAYPQIALAIVYVPDHAFLAVGLPQEDHDYALSTEYGTYILADATGPRLEPLGYINDETQTKIRTAKTDLLPVR